MRLGRVLGALLAALLLLVVWPGEAQAAWVRTASAPVTVSSGTLAAATNVTMTRNCGVVIVFVPEMTVTWTPTASTYATGYTVNLTTNGTATVAMTQNVTGRATSSATFTNVTRGVQYSATVTATFKNWTSPAAPSAVWQMCGILA